jgi:general secretion pathway protein D
MSEITGKSFIISDKVKGKISFVSSKDIQTRRVYDVVLSILKASGFYAVPGANNIVNIYPAQEALKMSGRIHYGTDLHEEKIEGIITQIIPLKFADAAGVINVIRPIFATDLLITAYDRTNSIIANGNSNTINMLLTMVQFLDTEIPQEISDIHIYNLENSEAETMAQTLATLSGAIPVQPAPKEGQPQKSPGVSGAFFISRFNVVANKETNSLIIISAPQDWEKIERLIQELDMKRQQVLVEAMIIEISLNDDQSVGFDWLALIDTPIDAEVITQSNTGLAAEAVQTGGLSGLTVGLLRGEYDMYAIINASKENTDFKILSTPEIVTVDNHEATITIAEQIPFLTSSRVDENNNVIHGSMKTTMSYKPSIIKTSALF